MKNIISWFANNHVAANLIMVFLILAGLFAIQNIKVEVFPDLSLDIISVSMEYPGASPAEIDEAIVRRIEERVAGLAGIERINSTSRENVGTVSIEVINGWDIRKLANEVKSEVDRIRTFPEEAEKPIVRQMTRKNQVINLALYGNAPEATIKHLAEKIKDDLTTLPEITLVDLFGVRASEIHIDIPEKTLRQYNLTLDKVANVIRRSSLDLPAGSIKTIDETIMIRTKGKRYYAEQYANIAVVTKPDGSKVTLGDIAQLNDGFEDVDISVSTHGKAAAFIQVYRVADQNALDAARAVKTYIEDIRGNLPEGMEIEYFNDMSVILRSRINLLMKNMALGLLLVVLILSFFLNFKLSFWVTLGIPISFAAALWLLPYFSISINMISLFAFILIHGIVVDDAIVVGENVFRKREKGIEPLKAAIDGTVQMANPVIFAVLTTIAAFWPLLNIGGVRGNIMKNIPVVVILVLLGSLVEALLILPSHLARSKFILPDNKDVKKNEKPANRWLKKLIRGPYHNFLKRCLKWRYATMTFGIALLIISISLLTSGRIKMTIFPKIDSDMLVCSIVMPPSTPVAKTREILNHIEQSAIEMLKELDTKRPEGAPPLLKQYYSLLGVHMRGMGPVASGSRGGHLAQVHIQLISGEDRDIKATYLAGEWRKKTGTIPDIESISFTGQMGGGGTAVEIDLSSDDDDKLLSAVDAMKSRLQEYTGLRDINDNYMPGKNELQIKLLPEARSIGITLSDLASQVRAAFYGAEGLRIQRGQDEVKILVRYPDAERKSLGNIETMRIRMPDGTEIPFNRVAKVSMEEGYATISRSYRRRVIAVSADIDEETANSTEVNNDLIEKILPELRNEWPGVRFAIEGAGKRNQEFMSEILKSFLLTIFLIYALLAIPFKSFSQPLIVMSAIPFGMVGALLGHLIMGYDLSMMSLFGIVGLSGVVVNDSLILIEATNRLREGGKSHFDSIVTAGTMRFRPIILTSLTTFGSLMPMILERSIQAKFLIPMAAGLAFGVLFATGITLLLIPCLYLILEDIHNTATNMRTKIFG